MNDKISKNGTSVGSGKTTKKSSKGLLIAGGLAAVLVIGGGSWAFLANSKPAKAPDPTAQKPEEKVAFITSDQFKSLPDKEKQEYFRKAMENGGGRELFGNRETMTDEERQKLRENIRPVFESMQKERVDTYFDLKTQQEKVAYLDKQIDEMEKRRKEWEQRRASGDNNGSGNHNRSSGQNGQSRQQQGAQAAPAEGAAPQGPPGEGRGRGAPNLDRMKQRIETTNPKDRAKATEFRLAMRARMEQRGIKPPERGGRGGTGSGGPGGGGRQGR